MLEPDPPDAFRELEHVTQLRQWGSDATHVLPAQPTGPRIIGTSPSCAVRLAGRRIAPEHAELTFDDEHWRIRNRGTPYGVRQDGVPRSSFVLMPGTEIGIGATTLVAESSRMAHLRKFCQRLLGWGPGRLLAVDQALRALRLARAHRASLILCGDGDLVPIAYALHRRTFDHAAPFIACDPRRMDMPGDVRSPPNVRRVVEAFARASGGTLCLRARRLPHGVDKVIQRAWEPDSEVQLVVCASHTPSALLTGTTAIQLPPLRLRQMELPRIIAEYTVDAVASLGLRPDREYVTDADHRWITARSAMSLIEIEKATLRIIALAASRTVFQAAARLGMASVSLLRWLGRRGYDIRRSAISNEPADTIGDHP